MIATDICFNDALLRGNTARQQASLQRGVSAVLFRAGRQCDRELAGLIHNLVPGRHHEERGIRSAAVKSFIVIVDSLPSGWLFFESNIRPY